VDQLQHRPKNRWGRFDYQSYELKQVMREYRLEDALRGAPPRLLTRICRWIAFYLNWGGQVIPGPDPKSPYLLRVYLTPKMWFLPSPYLHHFFRSGMDKHGHNYPWLVSVSMILTKGYREWRYNRRTNTWKCIDRKPWRLWAPWRFVFVWRNTYHRVELRNGKPWTLFTTFWRVGKEDSWGFWVPGKGHVPWKPYIAEQNRGGYAAD
jgi:hypothetical protein